MGSSTLWWKSSSSSFKEWKSWCRASGSWTCRRPWRVVGTRYPGQRDSARAGLLPPKNSVFGGMGLFLTPDLQLTHPLQEAIEAVTKTGKVGGTVGRKEADCGIGVCPGQLQTGLNHSNQVGAIDWQCFLQPTVEKSEDRGIL